MPESSVAAFPIYNPTPTLRIDEREFVRVRELVIAMDVCESEGGLSTLALRLSNIASNRSGGSDFAFENEEDVKLGSNIVLYSGDATAPQEIFRGIVTGIEADFPEEGPPEIVLYAEDTLQKFRMARRTKLYEDASLSDIVNEIANAHGVSPVINGLSDSIGTWMQLNESDLAFLRRLLSRYDGDLQIVESELHVSPRQEVQRGNLELELHSQLRCAKFFADLSDQVSKITVTGWNAARGNRVSGESEGRNLGPGEGRSGASILRDASGERKEHIGHIAVNTDEEATALANAAFDQSARKFVTVEGITEGNPALRVGTHVRITGASPRFENTYYVTQAQHRYDVSKGYETHFTGESYVLGNA